MWLVRSCIELFERGLCACGVEVELIVGVGVCGLKENRVNMLRAGASTLMLSGNCCRKGTAQKIHRLFGCCVCSKCSAGALCCSFTDVCILISSPPMGVSASDESKVKWKRTIGRTLKNPSFRMDVDLQGCQQLAKSEGFIMFK